MAANFEPVINVNYFLVAPPPTKGTAIDGFPRVAFYDALGEPLYNSNSIKHWNVTFLPHKDGGIPLNVLPTNTTSKLAGLFSTLTPFYAEHQAGKP